MHRVTTCTVCTACAQGLSGDSGFLAANLYARSIFGEDALANLSVEKPFNKPDAPVIGHIRIRAKSQVRRRRLAGLAAAVPGEAIRGEGRVSNAVTCIIQSLV